MEFNVLGDITPIVIEELGEYVERDVDFSTYLKGASGIDLPGWSPFLTYYGCFANSASKVIIQRLYDEGLIKLLSIRTLDGRIYVDDV